VRFVLVASIGDAAAAREMPLPPTNKTMKFIIVAKQKKPSSYID
jgi:hypothetical protein